MFFKRKFRQKQKNLIISIGAGINQLPIIREAKELGYHVIGVDQNTNSPGLLESDIKIQESISDYEEIYKKIRELLIDGEIKAIVTRSYGDAVKTTAYLCEKLNIPYLPFEKVDYFLDKKKLNIELQKFGIQTPSYNIYSPKRKRPYNYPCVIKPISGHAKTGVQLIKDDEELKKYIKSNETNKEIILEEYIPGDEIIAIGLISSKKFNLYTITDKEITAHPYFADLKHSAPSKYYDLWDKIVDIGQKIADGFNIINAPLLIEMRIRDDNEIFVIETAPEFGGEFLSDILIPNLLNTSIMKNCIKVMSDKSYISQNFRKVSSSVVIKYIEGRNGYLQSFSPLNIPEYKNNILFYKIFKDIGTKLTTVKTNHDRLGVVAVKAKSMKLANSISEKAVNAMNIKITSKKSNAK